MFWRIKIPVRNWWKGFKNFWYFRKEIYQFRDWDHAFPFYLLLRGLERLGRGMKKNRVFVSVNQEKEAKRCLYAARLLKDVVDEVPHPYYEKIYDKIFFKSQDPLAKWMFKDGDRVTSYDFDRSILEEYSLEKALKADREFQQERIDFTFKYIAKHFKKWWV